MLFYKYSLISFIKRKIMTHIITDEKLLDYYKKMERCILSLLNISSSEFQSEDEIMQIIIDEIQELTSSQCGYLHIFNYDEDTIELKCWSKDTKKLCQMVFDNHYPLSSAGIWADSIRQRQPIIHNDYDNVPNKKGLPDGHFPLKRHMSIPIYDNNKIVMVIGVGNKEEPYDELDIKQMQLITQNLWRVICYKRYETTLKKINNEMRYDYLTKTFTRRELELNFNNLDKSSKKVFAFLDLDNFKFINDLGGYHTGDLILKEFSQVLKTFLSDKDFIGRLGGDEFGIVFLDSSISNVYNIFKKFISYIEDYKFTYDNNSFQLKMSIGLVLFTDELLDQVIIYADSACSLAKDAGKNQIKIFDHSKKDFSQWRQDLNIASKIFNITETNDLNLFIQPIKCIKEYCNKCNLFEMIDFSNKKSCGFEVLLRIQENNNLVSPVSYINAAEKYNISIKIDEWVITHCIDQFSEIFNSLNKSFMIFINISGKTISNREFLDFLVNKIKDLSFRKNICFEITETAAINNFKNTLELINIIRELGCKFALDDFGVGVSSFYYLKKLPVDFIKIDGAFVQDLTTNPFSQIICKAINDIAHSLDILTIAEFVEDENTFQMLKNLGVDFAQGYHLSKPFPIEKCYDFNTL